MAVPELWHSAGSLFRHALPQVFDLVGRVAHLFAQFSVALNRQEYGEEGEEYTHRRSKDQEANGEDPDSPASRKRSPRRSPQPWRAASRAAWPATRRAFSAAASPSSSAWMALSMAATQGKRIWIFAVFTVSPDGQSGHQKVDFDRPRGQFLQSEQR